MSLNSDSFLDELQGIGAKFWKIYFNKEPSTQDPSAPVPDVFETGLTVFKRALIIIIILFAVFLFSIPAIIVGSIARVNNATCIATPANWLIILGCIGVVEAAILITFVLLKATCCHSRDQCVLQFVLKIAISILIIGPCIQIVYGIIAILDTLKVVPKCSDGYYYYTIVLFSILCFFIFIFLCFCMYLKHRSYITRNSVKRENKNNEP